MSKYGTVGELSNQIKLLLDQDWTLSNDITITAIVKRSNTNNTRGGASMSKFVEQRLQELEAEIAELKNNALTSEIITNEYGTATKYSDGTMICEMTIGKTMPCNQAWGNIFIGFDNEAFFQFAEEFIETPKLFLDISNNGPGSSLWKLSWLVPYVSTSGFTNVGVARATAANTVHVRITAFAKGRWK